MQTHSSVLSAALVLALLPVALGHGAEESGMDMASDGAMSMPSATAEPAELVMTYFLLDEHVVLGYIHIILMILAWALALPVAVMLSIARSRFNIPSQFVFLVLNGLGLFTGVIYNAQTPDLYVNNAHHKMGWIFSVFAAIWFIMAIVRSYVVRKNKTTTAFTIQSITHQAMAKHQAMKHDDFESARWSGDSGQGTERNTESLCSPRSMSLNPEDGQLPVWKNDSEDEEVDLDEQIEPEKRGFLKNTSVDRFLSAKLSRPMSTRGERIFKGFYQVFERLILIAGFLGIVTGFVTYSGVFQAGYIFNGLAHTIKGSIFIWYGFLTLGRWMGCFADLGWAWNRKPGAELVGRGKSRVPTAEFTESFVIFLYGASNVFLEHLAAWGKEWSPMDLEHISITILFFGGGLLGMLVESKRIRLLLNSAIVAFNAEDDASTDSTFQPPDSYNHSLNPMPALVIMLLGKMMSGHTQHSMVSSMIHKSWGMLFMGFAVARVLTYVTLWLKPPTNLMPTRPPTELVSSFCLVSGGIMFVLSNSDTIRGLERYQLDSMFVYAVTSGLTALLMAWTVILVAIKGWAIRYERRRST